VLVVAKSTNGPTAHETKIIIIKKYSKNLVWWQSSAMASLGFDLSFGALSSNVAEAFVGSISMDGDEYVRCTKCGYGGCDVRVTGCGCTLHAVSCVG
jgi:hypothetical protein